MSHVGKTGSISMSHVGKTGSISMSHMEKCFSSVNNFLKKSILWVPPKNKFLYCDIFQKINSWSHFSKRFNSLSHFQKKKLNSVSHVQKKLNSVSHLQKKRLNCSSQVKRVQFFESYSRKFNSLDHVRQIKFHKKFNSLCHQNSFYILIDIFRKSILRVIFFFFFFKKKSLILSDIFVKESSSLRVICEKKVQFFESYWKGGFHALSHIQLESNWRNNPWF